VLLLGGLLAIGGAVFAKLRKKSSGTDNWQSSYTPPPPPAPKAPSAPTSSSAPRSADAPFAAPVTASAPVSGAQGDPLTDPLTSVDSATDPTDDIGGGAPGEALSDAVETPHEVSSPDSPAEIIDVDDMPDQKKS